MHETGDDIRNQREVMSEVIEWMQLLPAIGGNGQGFTSKEIPTVAGESSPDYQLWWNHLCVGVVEVKCFSKCHDTYLIDRPKLEMLWKNYQNKGIPALLVFAHVVDGLASTIHMQDLRTLIAKKDQWQEAPERIMTTTNHGTEQRKKPFEGFLLPKELFWEVL